MVSSLPDASKILRGLGIANNGSDILLFYNLEENDAASFRIAKSSDGIQFEPFSKTPEIKDNQRRRLDTARFSDFRISKANGKYVLTYKFRQRNQVNLYCATSSDLILWQRTGKIENVTEIGMVVPDHKVNGKYLMFYGEEDIKVALSSDLVTWETNPEPVLQAPTDQWGTIPLSVGTVLVTNDGIILVYYAKSHGQGADHISLHAVVLDKNNPRKLLWQSDTIWEQREDWSKKKITPLGLTYFGGKLISYWDAKNEGIFAIPHATLEHILDFEAKAAGVVLKRFGGNPIIKPIVEHFWESKATFNPAAVYEGGKVHLVYRAIGDSDTSVLGYASSSDGYTIDERLDYPIFYPTQPFESSTPYVPVPPNSPFASGGGGWGGCEDPRLTKVGDKFYMTYVAYDGWRPPRVALSSIRVEDFMNKNWNWETPVLISPPNVVDKNAVLFPEKINGKYVMMHRIFPNILVDFLDNLDFDGTTFLKGQYKIRPSRTGWDSRKVGAGAPPIKTKYGWLLIYHAVGEQDSGRYKMGAMILDEKDPTKVLARSLRPILAPDDRHENEGWKAGVAYPCGSVIVDDNLMVYYGGADMVVCTAIAPVNKFLDGLMETGVATLEPVRLYAR